MPSLNRLNKKHPQKKNTGPAVQKGSQKRDASSADLKKVTMKKVVEKAKPQHKKKSAPIIKGKPSKNPVLSAAVKKQPVKVKPAGKAAQQIKKKAPIVKAKPSKKPAPPAAAKKQPLKAKPAKKAEKQIRKKEAPAVKAKPSKKPAPPAAAKKQPATAKPAKKAEKQIRKKEAPAVKTMPTKKPAPPIAEKKQPATGMPAGKTEKPGEEKAAPTAEEKTFETKVISFEMDQQSAEKDVVVAEKIQAQNIMVSSAGLGKRYKCYKCDTKFYDLGKPQPLCPSCGANQLDGVTKAARKRKGRQRSAFAAKTEPHSIALGESEDLHEVANELDAEFVLDVDDIVLEEHEDTEDKE
jgi:hypothetical protein